MKLTLFFCFLCFAVFLRPAHAQVLTGQYSASYNVQIYDGVGPLIESITPENKGLLSVSGSDGEGSNAASAQIFADLTPLPGDLTTLETRLMASDTETNANGFQGFAPPGNAIAELTYYFEIVGPANPNIILDVNGMGGGSASAQGITNPADGPTGTAEISITGPGVVLLNLKAGYFPPDPSLPTSFNLTNQTYSITANTPYQIDLQVVAGVGSQDGGEASAYIDPALGIDPSNPGAGAYSIIYSSNIAVPEPSDRALALIASAAIVCLVSRQKMRRA